MKEWQGHNDHPKPYEITGFEWHDDNSDILGDHTPQGYYYNETLDTGVDPDDPEVIGENNAMEFTITLTVNTNSLVDKVISDPKASLVSFIIATCEARGWECVISDAVEYDHTELIAAASNALLYVATLAGYYSNSEIGRSSIVAYSRLDRAIKNVTHYQDLIDPGEAADREEDSRESAS